MEPNSAIPVYYKTMRTSAPASLNLFHSQFQRMIKLDHFHFFSTKNKTWWEFFIFSHRNRSPPTKNQLIFLF